MRVEQVGPSSLLRLLGQTCLDLDDLKIDIRTVADSEQHASRDFVAAATDQPARSFGEEDHSSAEDESRCNRETEHPAPTTDSCEREIDQVSANDSGRDRELKKRDNPAAGVGRRNFGEI